MARRTTGATGAEVFCWALPLLMVVLPGIILSRNEKGSAQEDTRTRKYKKEARRSSRKNFSFRVFEEAAYLCVAERADEPRETHRLQASWDIPPIVTVKSNEMDPYGFVRQEIKSFCLPYGGLWFETKVRQNYTQVFYLFAGVIRSIAPPSKNQHDRVEEAMELSWEMLQCGFLPSRPTFLTVLAAISILESLRHDRKCVVEAVEVLDRMLRLDVMLWTAGFSAHGKAIVSMDEAWKFLSDMRDNASTLVTRQYDSEAEKNGVNISAAMDHHSSNSDVEDEIPDGNACMEIELAREMGCSSWRKHGVLAVAILGAATAMAAATIFLGRSLTDAAKSLSDTASSLKESLDSSAKSFKESFDSSVASFDRGVAALDRGIDTIGAFKICEGECNNSFGRSSFRSLCSPACKFKTGGNLLEQWQHEEFHGQVACQIAEQRCHHEHQAALEEWGCYFGYDVKTAAVPNEMMLLLLASPQGLWLERQRSKDVYQTYLVRGTEWSTEDEVERDSSLLSVAGERFQTHA
ncbi:hypothetical protein SELMODRAFT_403755 [Selaginella moellendorffii]|uniref:Uncharacterized protein n=1 Tax=Selaginella moellendorffii TaxID=88036 RepID=D8QSF3_SELML|nr:hypothetical protein SELMODRAFT_403755 [Selaginella moellendorffii]